MTGGSSNRRARRHTTGSSNSFYNESTELPSISRTLTTTSPRDICLLSSSRLVRVPKEERDGHVLSEKRTQDRSTVMKVHEKMWITGKQPYLLRVLRSYDPERTGALTTSALRAAMDRLNLGLSEEEKDKVVARLDPDNSGSVPQSRILSDFEVMQPLGQRFNTGDVRTRAPWEDAPGPGSKMKLRAWNWSVRPQGVAGISDNATPGSYEQRKEDAYLMALVTERFAQAKDKLRLRFRRADINGNGLVDRSEFVGAMNGLGMGVGNRQLERIFEICDVDGSGCLDYEEFISSFEGQGGTGVQKRMKPKHLEERREGATLAQTMEMGKTEVDHVLRSPLIFELRRRLYTKAGAAHNVFADFDVNGDGYLSVDELTTCCSTLVPGLTQRDVAALMVHNDPSGDGYLDYKEFIKGLVEDAAPHPRLVDAQLLRASAGAPVRNGWGHSPVWNRPTTPRTVRAARAKATNALAASAPSVYWSRPMDPDRDLLTAALPGIAGGEEGPEERQASEDTAFMARWGGDGSASCPTSPSSPTRSLNLPRTHSQQQHRGHHSQQQQGGAGGVSEREAIHGMAIAPVLGSMEECARDLSTGRFRPQGTLDVALDGTTTLPPAGRLLTATFPHPDIASPASPSSPATATGGWQEAGGAGSGSGRTGGTGRRRFPDLMFPDTGYVTKPSEGTSQWAPSGSSYLRKSEGDFLEYQAQDKDRKAKLAQEAKTRFDATSAYLEKRCQADTAHAEGPEAQKLAAKGMAAARYAERAVLFDAARSAEQRYPHFMFSRAPFFTEHAIMHTPTHEK